MSKTPVLALLLAAGAILPGCYKSEFEAEKKKAEELETKVKQMEADLGAARTEAASLKQRIDTNPFVRAATAGNGTLKVYTYVNGAPEGYDEVRINSNGELVRHGLRYRSTSQIRYEGGRIADQAITINSSSGKPYITGATKNSAPDGDWIWYSSDGKPANKEVWKDGRLVELYSAGAADKNGQPTWKKMSNAERDDWFKRKTAIFANLPELNRQLGAAPPATSTTGTGTTGTTPAGTTPKTGATPAKPAAPKPRTGR